MNSAANGAASNKGLTCQILRRFLEGPRPRLSETVAARPVNRSAKRLTRNNAAGEGSGSSSGSAGDQRRRRSPASTSTSTLGPTFSSAASCVVSTSR